MAGGWMYIALKFIRSVTKGVITLKPHRGVAFLNLLTTLNLDHSLGMCGYIISPSYIGLTLNIHCVIATNIHEAVPISHEFLAMPNLGDVGPTTVCAYTYGSVRWIWLIAYS